jgi:hypothetical protein
MYRAYSYFYILVVPHLFYPQQNAQVLFPNTTQIHFYMAATLKSGNQELEFPHKLAFWRCQLGHA